MDREAEFGRLYEAHRAAVHAYFTGRTGDRQLAADLMQDVFLRAWQHLDKVADLPEDGQRGWLFTVARNLSVDAALVTLVLPSSEDAARDLGVLNIANAGPQVVAPLLALLIINYLGGYPVLFVAGGLCGVVGAFAVMPVRSVR